MSALVRREVTRDGAWRGTVWYDGDHVVKIDSWRGRLLAARRRVPRPTLSRYQHHYTWHVCRGDQHFPFDDERWIEVSW